MPDDQTRLVKERNDIVDVIGSYVNLTRIGRVYRGLCPFHDDHRPSFQVDPVKQSWVCWPCNLRGDVYDFIQRKEHLNFIEAKEFLAKRVNIELKKTKRAGPGRNQLYEVMSWAAEKYHSNLFQPENQRVLDYLTEERQLSPETLERYQLGYAPNSYEFLAEQASRERKSSIIIEALKLCGLRKDGSLYDRFRDRIVFPIRDVQGRVIALGGRLLPGSNDPKNPGKYYNSEASDIFVKSRHLYGLDVARSAAEKKGYLAVVEGYTDVLMAHQHGVLPVVATLGTALNEEHISHLKRYVSRVVLVFDGDEAGAGGMERALSLFVQSEMELAIASLPEGMDPCDFLQKHGPTPFQDRLEKAQDALEFTLTSAFAAAGSGVEGRRQAVEKVLAVLAKLPPVTRENLAVKRDLILSRLAQRSGVPEATLRKRLHELHRQQNRPTAPASAQASPRPETPEDKLERELIQILIVQPKLIAQAREHIQPEMLGHANRRRVLAEMYQAQDEGAADLDTLRERLADDPQLVEIISRLHAEGIEKADPEVWFSEIKQAYLRAQRKAAIDRINSQLKQWDSSQGPPNHLYQERQSLEREAHTSEIQPSHAE